VIMPLSAKSLATCCYTVVTQLLHSCYTIVTQLLHNCYAVVTKLLHCCHKVVTQLLHTSPMRRMFSLRLFSSKPRSYTIVTLLLHWCHILLSFCHIFVTLLLHCCHAIDYLVQSEAHIVPIQTVGGALVVVVALVLV
jgi:hypothetical protein